MGLNLSNRQIAQELGLNKDDVQHMTTHLRQGLAGAGLSRGPSSAMKSILWPVKRASYGGEKKGRKGRRNRLKGRRGLAGEKPPILGMIQRGGEVVHSDAGECPATNH